MRHLYFARHGQSVLNVSGHSAGHTDTPLTDEGRKQATEAGKKVKAEGLVFDLIVASPLSRAYDTAKLIAEEVGYPADKILLHDFFIERNFGELEGKPYIHNMKEWLANPFLIDHLKDVEKIETLHKRAEEAVNYLKSLDSDTILVVSHGAIGRSMQRVIENKTIHGYVEAFANAAIHKLI